MPPQPSITKQAALLNLQKLRACPRHLFASGPVKVNEGYVCEVCAGKLGAVDVAFYIRGYVAGGKPADDIWPGWTEWQPAA